MSLDRCSSTIVKQKRPEAPTAAEAKAVTLLVDQRYGISPQFVISYFMADIDGGGTIWAEGILIRSQAMRYLITILLFGSAGLGQDATVTFYSAGSMGKALLKAEATVGSYYKRPFVGFLFDDEHRLGLLQPGRFMTLHLPGGPHTFSPASAGSVKHPSEKVRLPLTLEPGKKYFVQLTQTTKGFMPFQHIRQVDCEIARQEASGTEPIKAKRVENGVRDRLESAAYFANCK